VLWCIDMENEAYWTNHPECVTRTWVEEITNPPVEGVQRWYHIEFDLAELLPPTSSVYLPIVVSNPAPAEGT